MIKGDFKSFHTELRPQGLSEKLLMLPPAPVGLPLPPTTNQAGKALAAIASGALAPRSTLIRSLV